MTLAPSLAISPVASVGRNADASLEVSSGQRSWRRSPASSAQRNANDERLGDNFSTCKSSNSN